MGLNLRKPLWQVNVLDTRHRCPTQERFSFDIGKESLKDFRFQQDNKLSLLNMAIHVIALALHNVQQIVCGQGHRGLCEGLLPVNGSLLRSELLKVNFTDQNGDNIFFDENGDPPVRCVPSVKGSCLDGLFTTI